MSRKPRLLYGLYNQQDSFAIAEEQAARLRARNIEAIKACRTVGDLRQLFEHTSDDNLESFIEYCDDDGLPDQAAWDWREAPGVGDGNWPGMPTQATFEAVEGSVLDSVLEATGGEVVDTMFGNPYIRIPSHQEEALLEALRAGGYEVVRGDDVINSLGN